MELTQLIQDVEGFLLKNPDFPYAKKFIKALKLKQYKDSRPQTIFPEIHEYNSDDAFKAKQVFIQRTGADPEFTDYLEYIGKVSDIWKGKVRSVDYWFKFIMRFKRGDRNELYTVYIVLSIIASRDENTINFFVFNEEGRSSRLLDNFPVYNGIKNYLHSKNIDGRANTRYRTEAELNNELDDTLDYETETELLIR